MKKVALIVGVLGQDGGIAFEYLSTQGYNVIGIDKDFVKTTGADWSYKVDISNRADVFGVLTEIQPDEVYYFAAFHQSSEDQDIDNVNLFNDSYEVNVLSLIHFLEGIVQCAPNTRIFYAASSLIFGNGDTEMQDETTPYNPNSIYGITKLSGLMSCRFYRAKYGVFAAAGILYNHESEYRSERFISMKIVDAAVKIKHGKQQELVVGDLSAEVDWGYAGDYVEAMHKILNADTADEYIIATGQKHSVRDLASEAFGYLGLDWMQYVTENKELLTRKRKAIVGNSEKLKKATGWYAKTGFREMVRKMIDYKNNQYT